MKHKIFTIALVLSFCWNLSAFCNSEDRLQGITTQFGILQQQISLLDSAPDSEKNEMIRKALMKQTKRIEKKAQKKLVKAQEELERLVSSMANSADEEEIAHFQLKIEALQSKIKQLSDVAVSIEHLKPQLAK